MTDTQPEVQPEVLSAEPLVSLPHTGDHQHIMRTSSICSLFLDTLLGTLANTVSLQSNDINQAHLSGKKAGGALWSRVDKSIVVALGSQVADGWHTTNSLTINPTGARIPTTQPIGDGRRRIKPVSISALEVPMFAKADLESGDHAINDSSTSGKQLGALVSDTSGVIYIAKGSLVTDTWIALSGGANVTPSARTFTAMKTKTGQRALSRQTYVASIPAPVVELAHLGSLTAAINESALSGKQEGAVVCYTNADKTQVGVAVALGSESVSKWVKLIDATEITPV